MKSPEQIAALAADVNGIAAIRRMNSAMLAQDESHLFPINGRFNATKRAIARVAKMRREGACIDDGLEYAYAVDIEISNIVNGSL